jgi:hypothetical protein
MPRALVLLFFLAACGHTHEAGPDNVETHGHASPPKDQATEPPHPPAPGATPPHDRPGEGAAPLPIATSPEALLAPTGAQQIQDKLATRGLLSNDHQVGSLDGPTREALRAFQLQSDLPATGVPDEATVKKLGLAPDDVFKHRQ